MTDFHAVLAIALAVRPELTDLLGREAGQQMQQQLDDLLHQAQAGENVATSIWELLTDTKATRQRVSQFQLATPKAFNELPGAISPIAAPKFKCPQCDYEWWRDRIGRPTPLCKIHNIPLEPVAEPTR